MVDGSCREATVLQQSPSTPTLASSNTATVGRMASLQRATNGVPFPRLTTTTMATAITAIATIADLHVVVVVAENADDTRAITESC